ncbi:MAG: sugar-binding protein [Candidatus Omnitrophota bacterium]
MTIRKVRYFTVAALGLFFLFKNSYYAASAEVSGTAEIRFVTAGPVIDGKLDDPAWKKADVLTGFTVPGDMDMARDQSEARMLFNKEYLYVGLKAYESSPGLMVREATSVFGTDSVEFFIQPDQDKETYYQVAVSTAGKVYTGMMLSPAWSPALKVATGQADGSWTVELAIPLSDLGITALLPGAEKKVRFNICRNDWAEPARGTEAKYSSFSPLGIASFHVPEMWSSGVMTLKPGEPREVVNKPRYVNLMANPEFDFHKDNYPSDWQIPQNYWQNGDVSRRETMAMSREWIIAATGEAYVVMRQDVKLIPGKTYTVRVKARKFGECNLGIIVSGSTILWNCPLTTDFRYYYAIFKAGEKPAELIFYRMGPQTKIDGMEFASVHLFEGQISPLSIRQFIRTGLEKKAENTEIPLPPNYYGVTGEKTRVMAVAYRLFTAREYLEIFAGLNIEADILITTGANQDTYYTETDPDLVEQRLDGNQYDVYMIGGMAVGRVGEALAKKISENTEKGAGLIINAKHARGNFKDLLARYKPAPAEPTHYLKQGLPTELYPMDDPAGEIKTSRADKGRIVEVALGYWDFKIYLPDADGTLAYLTFPHQRYSSAWFARVIYYASGKHETTISNISFENGHISTGIEGAASGAQLQWQLEDKNGRPVSGGIIPVKYNQAGFALPRLTMAGNYILGLWLKDGNGSVMDYNACAVKNEGPGIAQLESAREFHTGAEPGEFTAKLDGFDDTMTLDWELEDFAGRVLESGSVKAARTVRFEVPLDAVYTNLARLWVYLKSGGIELDAQRFAVYLPDRDRARLLNDYTVSVWPEGCTNPDAAPYVNRSLEMMGIRAKQHTTHILSLNDGLGTTANLTHSGGQHFIPSDGSGKPVINNIRQPSLSDPKILKEIEDGAKKRAESDRKYGPILAGVVDEPGLTSRNSRDEVDAHPESLKGYRKRMQEKYGTIERFNQRCSTNYKSFDEIGLVLTKEARARQNYAEFVEWNNYIVDRYVEAFRLATDSYHSQDPDVPISMQNSFGQRALGGNDYWKLLTRAGFGFSNEYTSMVQMDDPFRNFDELYRSFRPDMRVWGYIGYTWSKDYATFQPWWFALHRYGGFSFFSATGLDPGEVSWNLLDLPGLGLSQKGQLLKNGFEDSKLSDGLGKVFLEYDWAKRDIAILYSQPSLLVAWCRGTEQGQNDLVANSPYRNYFYSRHSARYLLEELLYQYDFVAPEQLDEDILNSYKVLILPHIEALSDANVQKITAFLKRGGVVISDIIPAGYDELGTPRGDSPFNDMKNKAGFVLFDNIFNDKDQLQREKMLALLNEKRIEPIIRCDDAASTSGREAMHFVKKDMHLYAVTRDFRRSTDSKEQQFVFPAPGHLYDVRESRYLGETDRVTCAIPNAGTKVYGLYPYQVTGIAVNVPERVQAGTDLSADIRLKTSTGKAGHHIFHVEVLPPEGEARWFMKRNIVAPEGNTVFKFRMAENDPEGNWTLRITDVMTGTTATKEVSLYQGQARKSEK